MPESLGKYGVSGTITHYLEGRTIEYLAKDGTWLIIRFTDGHEARIGWQDKSGNQLAGEPYLENLDVKLVLQGVDAFGEGNL